MAQQNTPPAPPGVTAPAGAVAVTTQLPNNGLSGDVLNDIVDLAMSGAIFNVEMHYSTRAWAAATNSHRQWNHVPFPPSPITQIPKSPGVYVFVLMPDLFNLPQVSGLLYVGKATSLYSRISAYISEVDRRFSQTQRPHIWRMVNIWNKHLHYFYTTTATVNEAEVLEGHMLNALAPYFNKEFPAETSARQRAFP